MHRYETSTPRAALAIAAATMTAMTVGLMVVVPAKMASGSQEAYLMAGPGAATLASAAAGRNPPCVDVDANRKPKLDPARVLNGDPKRKRQGRAQLSPSGRV